MNNEYFAEMHKLIEKAKSFERMGREEEALKLYLEIHEKFFPNTSDLFERPAILLEKRKRFDEAIQICEKAIKLIGEGKITGVKDNFERRINRIKTRSDYDGKLKTNVNKSDKANKKSPDKVKVKFDLFSRFKRPDKPTSEGEHRISKLTPTETEPNSEKKLPSDESHKERIRIKSRTVETESLNEPTNETKLKAVLKAVKPDPIEKETPALVKTETQEPIKPDFAKLDVHAEPGAHIESDVRIESEVPIKEQPKTEIHKPELKALPPESSEHKKRLQFKLPKIHLRKPHLEDFKTMIADIKNFKFSDMKFFIFDLSEIKQGKFKFRKPSKSEWLAMGIIVTTIVILAVAIANKPKSQFEIAFDTSSFEWSQDITTDISEENKKDLPPITATMIDAAVKKTQSMPGVRMAGVMVQKNVVGFIVMTTPEADRKQAKEASETFIKALASAAAAENKDLSGPGPIGYGELFDYYALLVVAGENYDNLLIKGSKNPKAPGIFWRNEEK